MSKAKRSNSKRNSDTPGEEQEGRLRQSLGIAPVIVLHRDTDLRVIWIYNPRLGIPEQELLGRLPEEAYPAEQAAMLRAFYEPVLRQGETAHALIELTARWSGATRLYEMFAQPLRDESGSISGISCTAYDATRLAATQKQLAAREAQLRLALDAANMGEWQYDVASQKLHYSSGFAQLYGLPQQQGPYPLDVFVSRLAPDDREQVRQAFLDAIANRADKVLREFAITWPDGTQHWVSSRGQVQYEGDQPVRIIGIDMDITDEKRSQQLLEQANTDLEQFAFAASHDLKEPVRTISSSAALLEKHLQATLDSTTQKYLDLIRRGSKQMERLINGLLEYAKTSYTDLEWGEVDLQALSEEVLELLASAIDETGSRITSDALPTVRGNRLMLSNALQNLISNAIKFRRANEPAQVHISAQQYDHLWIINVADNGLGVPEEARRRIFEPFHRHQRGQGRPGSGLGLALCKRVVERHGGRIWVESRPRGGAIFRFTLPAIDPEQGGGA